MLLTNLLDALQAGDIHKGVSLGREWLRGAGPGEPERALWECPVELKPKLTLLLRDLLARYPYTLVGAPVLLFWAPETPGTAHQLRLPHPAAENVEPCADLRFLGWVANGQQLPLTVPFKPEEHLLFAAPYRLQAVVALFKANPNIFELEDLELPGTWWAELFINTPGSLHITSRMLLPYPDAIEAARGLEAAVQLQAQPEALFISPVLRNFVMEAGALFRETCRHHYPEHVT